MSSAAYYKWLSITRALPSLGPSHYPSSHSELAFDTNGITEHLWPCVQPLLPKLPKQTLQPCWPPCCSEHACQVSSHLAIFALLVPSTWNATPQLSCMLALSHQNVSILTLPHYLPFLFPYPALNLPITFVPHWIGCNFVSWHVVDAQWICEEWINEKLNSIPHSSQHQQSTATNFRIWSATDNHKITILLHNKIPISLPEPWLNAILTFIPLESHS